MGLLKQAFDVRAAASPENPSTSLANPAPWLFEALGATGSATGIAVNEQTAMRSTAVFACVNKIAKSVASLPLPVYQRLRPRGKERAPDHPLYRVLHDRGNDEMTAMTVRQTIQGHVALRGNGYAEIEYDQAGQIRGLWPLRPDHTRPVRLENGELWFETAIPKTGEFIRLPAYRVFHLLGLSSDGMIGYSPIRQAAESVGINLALTKYGASFFGNGARPGGIIKVPSSMDMSDDAKDRLKNRWEERHQGLSRAHRIGILDEGMDYVQVGIAPNEAQFLESMQYSVVDIARLFDMPPHMIQDLFKSTNNNIEHQSLEFVVYTLRPWLVQWEQTIGWKLFSERERKKFFAEHLVDGLLRGDYKSRMEGYGQAIQNGIMSPNDARDLENMNPYAGGDKYMVNGNMTTVEKAGAQYDKQPAVPQARQLAPVFEGLIAESVGRCLRKEANDVTQAARKHLGKGDFAAFTGWVDDYYRTHGEHVERQLLPVLTSYGHAIHNDVSPDLTEYVRSYVSAYVTRHIGTSTGQIRRCLQDQEPAESVRMVAERWTETRMPETARFEAVAAGDYLARFIGGDGDGT